MVRQVEWGGEWVVGQSNALGKANGDVAELFRDVTVESAEPTGTANRDANQTKPNQNRFKHSTALARIGCEKRLENRPALYVSFRFQLEKPRLKIHQPQQKN